MTRQRCHLTRHAILDSIPLRMGRVLEHEKVYLEDCEEDVDGTGEQRLGDRERGNRHVLANCFLDDETMLGRWRFVLGKPAKEWHDPPVVTVLNVDRKEMKAEGTVTDTLRRERESGMHGWLTPQYVAEVLHGLYRQGKLSRVDQLNHHIRERDKEPLVKERDEALQKANRATNVALEAIDALEDSERKVSTLELRNTELEAKEARRQEREKAEARSQNQTVSLSSADTLVDVLESHPHRGSSCTVLVMGDGTQRHMKTATFDRDGRVTAKARELIGRRIRVSCWDPINEPGKWTRQGYFRNVYAVDSSELPESVDVS